MTQAVAMPMPADTQKKVVIIPPVPFVIDEQPLLENIAPAPVAEKLVPHNLEAEEAVLGALLIDYEAILKVASFLKPEDFYIVKNGWIYDAILDLHNKREPVDFLTVCDVLEARGQIGEVGIPYVGQICNSVPTAVHVQAYAHLVEKTALRRRLITAAGEIAGYAYQEDQSVDVALDRSEAVLFEVSQQRVTGGPVPMNKLAGDYYDRIEYLYDNQDKTLGIPTGFVDLDKLLGGCQKSDFIIIAARPGVGKTSLLLNIALQVAMDYKQKVGIFSLEMSNEQLTQRLMSRLTGIDSQRLRLGDLRDDEWGKFAEMSGRLSEMKIFVDDTSWLSAMQLRTKARRLHAEHGLDMIMVDYLQLMSGEDKTENRVQELSYISRMLKGLARELGVPLIAASQLSRAVEQRNDKRPILSDLRGSGCLAGDTLVQMADGRRLPIRDLAESKCAMSVLALNQQTWKLEMVKARKAWKTGVKPVFKLTTQLGKQIRATGNHKFRMLDGWASLNELSAGDHIALPRSLGCIVSANATMTYSEVTLLGHLIGDGCTLPSHAVQYTTGKQYLAEIVVQAAVDVFGNSISPRINPERTWLQVYLSASEHLTHRKRNPVAKWLDELGAWGYRSYEKRVPDRVFAQPDCIVECFLKHLWSTDGTIGIFGKRKPRPTACYATSSETLARDVQYLLGRLGIISRISSVSQKGKGRDQWHVTISSKVNLLLFLSRVGAVGARQEQADAIRAFYHSRIHNTNLDVIPAIVWRAVIDPARHAVEMSHRGLQKAMRVSYSGMMCKKNMSRERALKISQILQSNELERLAASDVYWDKIASIEPDGIEDVYDLEVPEHHNFIAGDTVVHNSLEQDSDVVMFLYRDELYNPDTELKNIADVLVKKHRHGPVGDVQLLFRKHLTQFVDAEVYHQDLSELKY